MIDKETKSTIEKGQRIKRLVDSEDWKLAKQSLEDKIKLLDSISSLPLNLDREELIKELTTRQGAIDLIRNWIAQVEAEAQQATSNIEAMTVTQTTDYIVMK